MQINSKSLNGLQGLTIYSPCQCPASAAVEQLSHGHSPEPPAQLGTGKLQPSRLWLGVGYGKGAGVVLCRGLCSTGMCDDS